MKAVLLAIGAGLCWGVGEVFTKSVLHTRQVGPVTAIAVRSLVALPLLWIAYVLVVHVFGASNEPKGWLRTADGGVLAKLVLGSGVIAGACAMVLFYLSLGAGEVSRVKPIAFTVAPATAVILGWVLLGESMDWRKGTGVVLILCGVVLLAGGRHGGA